MSVAGGDTVSAGADAASVSGVDMGILPVNLLPQLTVTTVTVSVVLCAGVALPVIVTSVSSFTDPTVGRTGVNSVFVSCFNSMSAIRGLTSPSTFTETRPWSISLTAETLSLSSCFMLSSLTMGTDILDSPPGTDVPNLSTSTGACD